MTFNKRRWFVISCILLYICIYLKPRWLKILHIAKVFFAVLGSKSGQFTQQNKGPVVSTPLVCWFWSGGSLMPVVLHIRRVWSTILSSFFAFVQNVLPECSETAPHFCIVILDTGRSRPEEANHYETFLFNPGHLFPICRYRFLLQQWKAHNKAFAGQRGYHSTLHSL